MRLQEQLKCTEYGKLDNMKILKVSGKLLSEIELTPQEEADFIALNQPSLEQVRAEKRAEIIAARNAVITGGFSYLGKRIDSDRDSVMSITGAGVAALAAKASGLPYSVTWTCADDSTIILDADGVLGMVIALAMFADTEHTKARPLKEAVKNAVTMEELKAVGASKS